MEVPPAQYHTCCDVTVTEHNNNRVLKFWKTFSCAVSIVCKCWRRLECFKHANSCLVAADNDNVWVSEAVPTANGPNCSISGCIQEIVEIWCGLGFSIDNTAMFTHL